MKDGTKNILIVDNDLGFVFWLGAVLIDAGCQPWPACSTFDAISVADRRPSIQLDLLIVNSHLPGVSELIAHFRRTQPQHKVLALGSPDESLPGVDAWRLTPGLGNDSAKREFIRTLKRLVAEQDRAA